MKLFKKRNLGSSMGQGEGKAYDNPDFQSYVVEKTKTFINLIDSSFYRNTTVSKLAGLAFVCSPCDEFTNIVDIGGGAGIDFFIATKLFGDDLNWEVLETEVMCKTASQANFDRRLKFQTLGNFLQRQNVEDNFSLYSNSSLQYIPDPIETLGLLLLRRPSKVAILRTPFVLQGEEVDAFQKSILSKNGPQVESLIAPKTVVSNRVKIAKIERLRKVLVGSGYEIVCENVQSGGFTREARLRNLRKSIIKTMDVMAIRME